MKEMLTRTGIPSNELERQIISLARFKLVLKEPRVRSTSDVSVELAELVCGFRSYITDGRADSRV